ncbi:MAG: hypothetical protein AAF602_22840, partial [Myxococcota bacterium]
MAITRIHGVWTTVLTVDGGTTFLTAPMHPEVAWLATPPAAFRSAFASRADARWNRTGHLLPWLDHLDVPEFVADRLELELEPTKTSPLPSPWTVAFDIVRTDGDGPGQLAFVPALGLTAAGTSQDEVRAGLEATVRLEFVRAERLAVAKRVLETQWYVDASSEEGPASSTFYTFSELRAFEEASATSRLADAALPVAAEPRQRVFEVEADLTELAQAFENPAGRNILIVGLPGVGKSAQVRELVRRGSLRGSKVWETTASSLERVLTVDGGGRARAPGRSCPHRAGPRSGCFVP